MSTKPTLGEFRQAALSAITSSLSIPTHGTLPGDVAELPCSVVGLPSWRPDTPGVLELELDLWIIARRQDAGGTEAELLEWAHELLELFGGARETVTVAGVSMHMESGASRVIDIAGQRALAYQTTLIASAITC